MWAENPPPAACAIGPRYRGYRMRQTSAGATEYLKRPGHGLRAGASSATIWRRSHSRHIGRFFITSGGTILEHCPSSTFAVEEIADAHAPSARCAVRTSARRTSGDLTPPTFGMRRPSSLGFISVGGSPKAATMSSGSSPGCAYTGQRLRKRIRPTALEPRWTVITYVKLKRLVDATGSTRFTVGDSAGILSYCAPISLIRSIPLRISLA